MIDRIVGGADSVCVLALQDAVLAAAALDAASDTRQRREAAIKAFTERLSVEVDLTRACNKKHHDKIVGVLRGLVPVEEPKIDVEGLLNMTLNDINLDDDNIFSKGDTVAQILGDHGHALVTKYADSGKPFFMERVQYDAGTHGSAYLAIGTSSGKHPKFPGQDFNVFCTTTGYRTIKDAGDDLVVHAEGRQLTKSLDKDGRSYFIRFVPITAEGKVWRFWASTNKNGVRKDVDQLRFMIRLDATKDKGYEVLKINGRSVTHEQTAAV
jgi:hypothetical protein